MLLVGQWVYGRQIVHDDDIARLERWHEDLLHIGKEGATMHGPVGQQRMFAMGAAIELRDDYEGSGLRRLARSAKDDIVDDRRVDLRLTSSPLVNAESVALGDDSPSHASPAPKPD